MAFVRVLGLVLPRFHKVHDVFEIAPKLVQVLPLNLLRDVVHYLQVDYFLVGFLLRRLQSGRTGLAF